MKFVDLSTTIESGLPSDPVGMIPEIKYKDHKDSIEYMLSFLERLHLKICRMAWLGLWKM